MEKIISFLKSLAIRIHPSGLMIVLGVAVASLFIASIFESFGIIGFIITLIVALYYRDPKRTSPQRDGLVLSPVDGTVRVVETIAAPEDLNLGEGNVLHVSIMTSLLGAHVGRTPASSKVTSINEISGAHSFADKAGAEENNHREVIHFEIADGKKIAMVKICGPVDFPVEQSLDEGQSLHAGERIGMLRPLSRIDLYIPAEISAFSLVGQQLVAGETIIADMKSHEPQRDAVTE